MSGPFGALTLPRTDPERYVLIGTGTGVAPYRAMLPELELRIQNNSALEIVLLMGVRKPAELIYGEEFLALSQTYPGFNFYVCYSREMPASPERHTFSGRVNTVFDQLKPDAQRDRVYLCGNPNMVDESADWFTEREFTAKNLKREKYKFSTF